VFKLFYKSKMKSYNSRNNVLQSLVRSVLMYCAPIWGMGEIDTLVKFENEFIRRLFKLPYLVPNWFLRMESTGHFKIVDTFFSREVIWRWSCRLRQRVSILNT